MIPHALKSTPQDTKDYLMYSYVDAYIWVIYIMAKLVVKIEHQKTCVVLTVLKL